MDDILVKNGKHLYKLDNAAKIYPACSTKDWNSVYRMAAVMKENVDPVILQQAVKDLAKRFPTYYTQLYKGFMWDYLIEADDFNIVAPESEYPCRPMKIGQGTQPMFRVLYHGKRISVEMFHCITDGTGAITYLKTLIARYLELLGFPIEKGNGILDVNDPVSPEEIEDSFQKIYDPKMTLSRKEPNAYQYYPPVTSEDDYLKVISGLIPLDELKPITKAAGCTITEYLVAVYAYAFYLDQKEHPKQDANHKRPIRISVPANLRPHFGSTTLRNFASFTNVQISPAEKAYTFEEALKELLPQMKAQLCKDRLHRAASTNVGEEKMLISRIAPNVLKKPFMKAAFHLYGENKYTSVITNIGYIKLPDSMAEHVDRFQTILGETVKNHIYCAAIGYKNIMNVSFSSISPCTEVQRNFFRILTERGIHIQIESNE